jgi:tetratricopeptide (TPR) repeat protein
MTLLPLAIVIIVGFSVFTLMKAWSTDHMVHRAHALLLRAKNGAADADNLLAACCAECTRAAARNPHDSYILKIWGAALWCRGHRTTGDEADRIYRQAEQKYVAALESKPDDVPLSLDLFWVLHDRAALHAGPVGLNLLERICDECDRLLILHPNHAELLSFWGNALESMGTRAPAAEADRLYAAAEDKYAAALAAKPGEVAIMNSIAALLWRRARRNRGEEARTLLARAGQWLDSALAVNPRDSRALSTVAFVLFSLSRLQPGDETDRMLSEAAVKFAASKDPELHQPAGLILWAQGRLEAAKEKLAAAEARQPGSASYNLACICAQLGQESECREWLERSKEPGLLVSREQMSTEVELAAVHERPWFRELVGANA